MATGSPLGDRKPALDRGEVGGAMGGLLRIVLGLSLPCFARRKVRRMARRRLAPAGGDDHSGAKVVDKVFQPGFLVQFLHPGDGARQIIFETDPYRRTVSKLFEQTVSFHKPSAQEPPGGTTPLIPA